MKQSDNLNLENYFSFSLEKIENHICEELLKFSLDDYLSVDIFYQAIHAIYLMDGDVLNGGFNQYFQNQEYMVEYAQIGLMLIGANEHLNILEKSYSKFESERAKIDNESLIDMGEFDELYYSTPNFYNKRLGFLIQNIDRFLE